MRNDKLGVMEIKERLKSAQNQAFIMWPDLLYSPPEKIKYISQSQLITQRQPKLCLRTCCRKKKKYESKKSKCKIIVIYPDNIPIESEQEKFKKNRYKHNTTSPDLPFSAKTRWEMKMKQNDQNQLSKGSGVTSPAFFLSLKTIHPPVGGKFVSYLAWWNKNGYKILHMWGRRRRICKYLEEGDKLTW